VNVDGRGFASYSLAIPEKLRRAKITIIDMEYRLAGEISNASKPCGMPGSPCLPDAQDVYSIKRTDGGYEFYPESRLEQIHKGLTNLHEGPLRNNHAVYSPTGEAFEISEIYQPYNSVRYELNRVKLKVKIKVKREPRAKAKLKALFK
jgi:hypothetical protein